MKKLNSLNLGKSLGREEMKNINGGLLNEDSKKKCGYCNSPYDCGSGCNGCSGNACYTIKW
jgi:hypothetical protein